MEKIGGFQVILKQYFMKYKKALLFGTWDPIHFGHIMLFRRAKKIADKVIVAIDSDELIKDVKKRKPFFSFMRRMEDVLAIRYVDSIVMESKELNKKHWIKVLKPDILIKGDDWKGKKWSGEGLGVKVKYFPYTKEINSTKIRKYGMGISQHPGI